MPTPTVQAAYRASSVSYFGISPWAKPFMGAWRRHRWYPNSASDGFRSPDLHRMPPAGTILVSPKIESVP